MKLASRKGCGWVIIISMSTNKITLLIVPMLLLGLFVFRSPHLTFSISSARGSEALSAPCEPDQVGNIDQTISVSTGATSSYDWTENVGCVLRPILDTWGVTQNPEEMGFANQSKSIVQAIAPPAGYTNLYRVTYTVQSLFTVVWTLDWLHQLVQGSIADPQNVLITVTKYSGSSLIEHFNGTLRLEKVSPLVTLVSLRLETKVPEVDKDQLGKMGVSVIQSLRTGTPFWDGASSPHLIDFE